MKKYFNLERIWDELIVADRNSEDKSRPRNHIWAGEISKNYWERFMKMKGVKPTNPPDPRVLRKYAAGELLERLVGAELSRVGLVMEEQKHIEIPATADTLKITGKIDFIVGIDDWTKAKKKTMEAPEGVRDVLLSLIRKWEKEYPEGIEPTILEIKSINSQVFWAKKDYLAEAYPFHVMQLYTYLKAQNMKIGKIIYLSKDDLVIKEMLVTYPDKRLEKLWQEDVLTMSSYILQDKEPPKPEQIVFDNSSSVSYQRSGEKIKIKGCYKHNWEIEWSSYFSLITGFKNSDDWKRSLRASINAANETLKINQNAL